MGSEALPKNVVISNHPVLNHKLTLLRDKRTSARDFRRLIKELTFYLGYEATASLSLKPRVVQGIYGEHEGTKLSESIALVPILRGGLGMVDPLCEILPMASIYHIGMFRNRAAAMPIQYFNRLPKDRVSDTTFVLDPLIATACTVSATVSILKKWGTKRIIIISVLGSHSGLQKLAAEHPDVEVHVAAVDSSVNEEGYIVPGIGDASDRLYNVLKHDADHDDGYDEDGSASVIVDAPITVPSLKKRKDK